MAGAGLRCGEEPSAGGHGCRPRVRSPDHRAVGARRAPAYLGGIAYDTREATTLEVVAGSQVTLLAHTDDATPVVRIVTPGRDRRLVRPLADLRVTIDARDDRALTHARTDLTPEARLADAQGLAVEQRMVRAEFVFLMGGEVEDEEEEAAQAHDLVEGRLANQGQAALLGATRAMSRAEARLVAEREALRLLQHAFDRRRFLLRPVAERVRIDPAR